MGRGAEETYTHILSCCYHYTININIKKEDDKEENDFFFLFLFMKTSSQAQAHLLWFPCVVCQDHQVDEGVRVAWVLVQSFLKGTLGLFVFCLAKETNCLAIKEKGCADILIQQFLVYVVGILQFLTTLKNKKCENVKKKKKREHNVKPQGRKQRAYYHSWCSSA